MLTQLISELSIKECDRAYDSPNEKMRFHKYQTLFLETRYI